MSPLHVVLVGIEAGFLPAVRQEVANAALEVECEFQSALMAIDCLRHYKKQARMLIVQVGADCEADTFRRLTTDLSGWPILAACAQPEDRRLSAGQIEPVPSRWCRCRSNRSISSKRSA